MVAYSYRRDNGKMSRLSTVLCLIGAISGVWQLGRWTGRRDAQLFLLERTLNSADGLQVMDEDPTLNPAVGHQDLRPSAKVSVPTHEEETSFPAQAKDKLHSDRFWEAYAADRHKMLAERSGGIGESPGTRYLVFSPANAGLGNHMAGMMSAFVLALATGRVFMHDWNAGSSMCQASYNDLFVAPFGPWSTAEARGGPISGSFGEVVKGGDDGRGAIWAGEQRIASSTDRGRCSLDLTQLGVNSGAFDTVFVDKRGQDPRPDCLVLYVTTHQYLVELLSHPAYGAPSVGGTPLSEWLEPGRATATLSAGLFRPVESVRQRIEDTAKSLLPRTGQTLAAHARAYHLGNVQQQQQFVNCVAEWALYKNVSTVVMATDIPGFVKGTAATLSPKGIKVVGMDGVQRLGESKKMRDSVDKTQMALTEMMLVSKAGVVVTSPRSSFSALAAAMGGASTERIGGISCKPVENAPEFHFFACGMKWTINAAKWSRVYGESFTDSNRERCTS